MNFNKKINKNLFGYIIGVGILLFLFVFVITSVQIGYSVKEQCAIAQQEFEGECVDALMSRIADNSTQLRKNDAIWALGQLGDKKALPFLKQYDNKKPLPTHEPWNEGISQYELRKAIKLLENGINISAFVWR